MRVRVNPVKYIDLADGYICYDSKTGLAISNHTIQSGLSASQYSFVWYQDENIIAGEIGNSLTVNEAGIYHVVATNLNTGCVSESGFSVISESYSAESVQAFVSNSFTHGAITVVVTGSGNYQYQLNGGAFQSSNVFTNVLPGTHRIVVIDSEGCTHEELEVHILSFMNFFTPNGDGIHDTWNIWSLSDQADAEIYIFDRHGKLIKQISPSGEGWDGTYNGVAVPSTDYWFSVKYRDGIHQEIRTYKSHFSLKR